MQDYKVPLEPGNFYHLYNHANGNDSIFKTHENYMFFMRKYIRHISPVCETFSYCLMPNHFHLLIRIHADEKLEKYFREKYERKFDKSLKTFKTLGKFVSKEFANFFSSYSQAFNKQQGRMGSLFIPNFKRKIIDNNEYLLQVVHYIHNNPVHHKFAGKIDEWKYSSYHELISVEPTFLMRNEVLEWFGSLENFKSVHNKNIATSGKLFLPFQKLA